VTRFQFRLVPVGMVYGGALIFPPTHEALRGVADAAAAAPDELTTIGFLMHLPPLPFVPAEQHFKLAYIVGIVHAGDPSEAEAAVAPFRALGPVADAVGPMPYAAIYGLTAEASRPSPGVIRSVFMDELSDDTIETILRRMREPSSPMAIAQIRTLGGQVARVAGDATAFAHRQAPVMVTVINSFQGDPAPHLAWSDAFHAELAPKANGVYSNFLADEGEARVREAYPEATYARLADVKRRYDPANLFRLNQNIRPAVPDDDSVAV
jgi:FAD/FMN-containing dehydrogenase